MAQTIIRMDTHAAAARVMGAFQDALPMLTEEILNDCNQYCKEDTGTLIQSSQVHTRFKDGVMIWKTPYARRQYWEIKTASTDKNPNATYKWVHFAKAKHQKEWVRKAARLMGVRT